jgi:hypothetical protein
MYAVAFRTKQGDGLPRKIQSVRRNPIHSPAVPVDLTIIKFAIRNENHGGARK